MGWTYYKPDFYKNGKVDRKAELDFMYRDILVKSRMVGNTYYAAVNGNNNNVFAIVVLTSIDGYGWFGYKPMDESMIPFSYDCPNAILKLLTETDNEHSLEWRSKCKANAEFKKLPIGTVIEFTLNGETKRAVKKNPAYQFKSAWWQIVGEGSYITAKHIKEIDWRVVE